MISSLLMAVLLSQVVAPAPCDSRCERDAAEQLLEQGELRAAVERLRTAAARYPDEPALTLLLARAYLLDGNLFWAERTLAAAVARRPDDVALRAWLAAVHLRQGDPELASSDLAAQPAPLEGSDASRRHLLEALRARLQGDTEAALVALAQVPRSALLYPEDRAAWLALHRGADPAWVEPLSGALDVEVGHTSNALAGSPTDPAASGAASALADVELRARIVPPWGEVWRPAVDLELLGHGLEEAEYRDLSTLEGAVRLGGLRSRPGQRLAVGYRADLLLINQDDERFAESHRGEMELETESGLLVFAGAGHRTYRDDLRTRWEADAGVGGSPWKLGAMPLVVGATLRLADAHSPAYDQVGVSLAAAGRVPVGRGFAARAAATASWDDYFHSGGSEGQQVFGSSERRRDLLGRLTVGLLGPSFGGFRPGVEGQLARRDSTLNDLPTGGYDYTEWRLLLVVRWSFASDPWAPEAVSVPGHVPLDWGLDRGEGAEAERIIELLRQDEDLRRASSCSPGRAR